MLSSQCLGRIVLGIACCTTASVVAQDPAWPRHVIDDTLRGADGVKLADANGDKLLDIVTGWEESGRIRAYFHPGAQAADLPWPKVDVGLAPNTEDAVWVDLNGDGQLDVLSCCEGSEQSLRRHLAPADRTRLLEAEAWETQVIPCSRQVTRWMFAMPFSDPHSGLVDIVVGSKSPNGLVGLLRTTDSDAATWYIQELAEASWVMSLVPMDIDHDGDQDILYSDRKSAAAGLYWLRNPGPASPSPDWDKNLIGALGREVMFVAFDRSAPATADSTIYMCVKPNQVFSFQPLDRDSLTWKETVINLEPRERIGNAKGMAVGDLDGDGHSEIILSCESAVAPKSGVVYFRQAAESGEWEMQEVSGPKGIKFDLIELIDLDLDGDLDILTCEEREGGVGLGIIWYANPHVSQ